MGHFRPGRGHQYIPPCRLCPRKRKSNQGIGICHNGPWRVDDGARRVIQAPKLEPRTMRRHTTTGSQENSYLASSRDQCCWPTEVMTPTGSEPLPPSGALGPTSRQDAIAATQSASAHTSIVPGIWSSGSSIRLNSVAGRNSLRQARSQLPRVRATCVDQAMAAR